MEVVRTRIHHPTLLAKGHLALGNFDGVHRGHRKILETAVELAREAGGQSGLVTFDPHPVEVLAPEKAPARLATLERRLEIVETLGLDLVLVVPFDAETAAMEAADFVQQVLLDTLDMAHISVGPDCRFGHARAGDRALLEAIGRRADFQVAAVQPVIHGSERISSSRIRSAIAAGDVAEAHAMLGRPHRLSGAVIRGDGRGRTLGFPTANLVPPRGLLLPKTGVYHGAVLVHGARHGAVINVGVKPTFGPDSPIRVEAHMLDHSEDLYGQEITVLFHNHIRSEQPFPNVEALVDQVKRDIDAARALEATSG
jgi:riboflavin kinase/FMN adenylyltransferase